jgi:hypothetical protein
VEPYLQLQDTAAPEMEIGGLNPANTERSEPLLSAFTIQQSKSKVLKSKPSSDRLGGPALSACRIPKCGTKRTFDASAR